MKILMIMDDISTILFNTDANMALLLEAQHRKYDVFYANVEHLFVDSGRAHSSARRIQVMRETPYYQLAEFEVLELSSFDVILMRKDPPYDMAYHNATQILSIAETHGARVFNPPQALRDVNEKIAATWFPDCCPPTLISRDKQQLHDFLKTYVEVVCKPLNAMGGSGVTRLKLDDGRFEQVFNDLSHGGRAYFLMQTFLPEVSRGDKRIILIDGKPGPYGYLRVPKQGSFLANLHAGGQGEISALTDKERWICQQVGATLSAKGLVLVGIDVIGDMLTEINVTCPGCLREIDDLTDSNLCGKFFDCLHEKITI